MKKTPSRLHLLLSLTVLCTIGAALGYVLHIGPVWLLNLNMPHVQGSISMALLFASMLTLQKSQFYTKTRKAKFFYAFICAWSYFAVGVHWLYHSMHVYGHLPSVLAMVLLLLFAAWHALFYALASIFARHLGGHIAAFALLDYARSLSLPGFSWLSVMQAQGVATLPGMPQLLSWGGEYIAGLCVLYAMYFIIQMGFFIHKNWNSFTLTWMQKTKFFFKNVFHTLSACFFLCMLIAIALWMNQAKNNHLTQSQTIDSKNNLHIRLIQGNIDQDKKFSANYLQELLNIYQKLITEKPADLIVTSETALPIAISWIPESFTQNLQAFQNIHGWLPHIIIGAINQPSNTTYYNALFALNKNTDWQSIYHKTHLVPLGEFIPYGFKTLVDAMGIPLADFAQGLPTQKAWVLVKNQQNIYIDFNICYELIFSREMARRQQQNTAHILLNHSNLMWFGDGAALNQFLRMGQLRALEAQKPLLLAMNHGITAHINEQGHIIQKLPIGIRGALDIHMDIAQLNRTKSFYILYCDEIYLFFIILCLIFISLDAGWFKKMKRAA